MTRAILLRLLCIPAWCFASMFAGLFLSIWRAKMDNLVDVLMKPALLVLAAFGATGLFIAGFLFALGRLHP